MMSFIEAMIAKFRARRETLDVIMYALAHYFHCHASFFGTSIIGLSGAGKSQVRSAPSYDG
jgi:hypothetical protein